MKFFSQSSLFAIALLYPAACIAAVQQPLLVPEKPIAAPIPQTNPSPAPAKANTQTFDAATAPPMVPGATPAISGTDGYPLIGRMETITFGQAKQSETVEERLTNLEQAVFRINYKNESLFDRTQRLKLAILGANDPLDQNQDFIDSASMPPLLSLPSGQTPVPGATPAVTYFDALAQNANNQVEVPPESLPEFAFEQVNYARAQVQLAPLTLNKLATRMADEQVQDLRKRKLVSHANQYGQNPDLRYTTLGGSGAVNESLVALKADQLNGEKYTRALVAHALKVLIDRQDDRDALLSPDATGFGFAVTILPGEGKAVACAEVSTECGAMEPISLPLKIGDKIEVKGSINAPYKFAKLTVAWEGLSNELPTASDETDEALPYFPPLDYVGYSHHSEHDYSTAMTVLRMTALVGVVAGSVFMPPVALAAPLIALSPGPGNGEPKPMSDIPLHGGVKISGETFSGKLTISNGGKPGIYYLTVWATSVRNAKPLPISRRAFVVGNENTNVNIQPIANAKTSS